MVRDDLARLVQDEVLCYMLLANDIVLVDETMPRINVKLEIGEVFQLSRTKTKCIECKFNKGRNKEEVIVRLDDQEIPKSVCF